MAVRDQIGEDVDHNVHGWAANVRMIPIKRGLKKKSILLVYGKTKELNRTLLDFNGRAPLLSYS